MHFFCVCIAFVSIRAANPTVSPETTKKAQKLAKNMQNSLSSLKEMFNDSKEHSYPVNVPSTTTACPQIHVANSPRSDMSSILGSENHVTYLRRRHEQLKSKSHSHIPVCASNSEPRRLKSGLPHVPRLDTSLKFTNCGNLADDTGDMPKTSASEDDLAHEMAMSFKKHIRLEYKFLYDKLWSDACFAFNLDQMLTCAMRSVIIFDITYFFIILTKEHKRFLSVNMNLHHVLKSIMPEHVDGVYAFLAVLSAFKPFHHIVMCLLEICVRMDEEDNKSERLQIDTVCSLFKMVNEIDSTADDSVKEAILRKYLINLAALSVAWPFLIDEGD